jgi:adenylosuccinate synthase
MKIDVILGLQWGDEGKGKIVDFLATQYDIVARFQGGPNAGHTLKFGGKKFVLHTVPSGIFRENLLNVIGNGVVIDPITLEREINGLRDAQVSFQNRLLVAKKHTSFCQRIGFWMRQVKRQKARRKSVPH